MRILATLLCVYSLLFCANPASAKLSSFRIEDLFELSEAIVIAKVTALISDTAPASDSVHAEATIERTLKSSLTGSFRFRASPTWVCDTSGAIKNETALLFLIRDRTGTFVIMHAGRGRMPLYEFNGTTYVDFDHSIVRLPTGAPTVSRPNPKYPPGDVRSVELAYLDAQIQKSTAAVKPTSLPLH